MKKYIVGCAALLVSFAARALPSDKLESDYPVVVDVREIDDPGPSECTAFPGNLAANCGFETGTFAPWIQSGDMSFTSVSARSAASGNFGAEFGPTGSDGFITQNIATTVGRTYAVSFKLRSSGQPNRFSVSWNGSVVYSLDNSPDFPFMWVSIGGLMATSTSTPLRFGFFNPPDWWFFDDVIVVDCPGS